MTQHRTLFFALTVMLLMLGGCGTRHITGIPSGSGVTAGTLGVKVVQTASSQVGRPYRLGGASPKSGFDCSGLIFWAYKQHGISVPRVTKEQARVGRAVSIKSLQPGDIVVFRSRSSSSGLHTGIYVGRGQFIHSPNQRSKVRVESISTPHWAKTFMVGRRI